MTRNEQDRDDAETGEVSQSQYYTVLGNNQELDEHDHDHIRPNDSINDSILDDSLVDITMAQALDSPHEQLLISSLHNADLQILSPESLSSSQCVVSLITSETLSDDSSENKELDLDDNDPGQNQTQGQKCGQSNNNNNNNCTINDNVNDNNNNNNSNGNDDDDDDDDDAQREFEKAVNSESMRQRLQRKRASEGNLRLARIVTTRKNSLPQVDEQPLQVVGEQRIESSYKHAAYHQSIVENIEMISTFHDCDYTTNKPSVAATTMITRPNNQLPLLAKRSGTDGNWYNNDLTSSIIRPAITRSTFTTRTRQHHHQHHQHQRASKQSSNNSSNSSGASGSNNGSACNIEPLNNNDDITGTSSSSASLHDSCESYHSSSFNLRRNSRQRRHSRDSSIVSQCSITSSALSEHARNQLNFDLSPDSSDISDIDPEYQVDQDDDDDRDHERPPSPIPPSSSSDLDDMDFQTAAGEIIQRGPSRWGRETPLSHRYQCQNENENDNDNETDLKFNDSMDDSCDDIDDLSSISNDLMILKQHQNSSSDADIVIVSAANSNINNNNNNSNNSNNPETIIQDLHKTKY